MLLGCASVFGERHDWSQLVGRVASWLCDGPTIGHAHGHNIYIYIYVLFKIDRHTYTYIYIYIYIGLFLSVYNTVDSLVELHSPAGPTDFGHVRSCQDLTYFQEVVPLKAPLIRDPMDICCPRLVASTK